MRETCARRVPDAIPLNRPRLDCAGIAVVATAIGRGPSTGREAAIYKIRATAERTGRRWRAFPPPPCADAWELMTRGFPLGPDNGTVDRSGTCAPAARAAFCADRWPMLADIDAAALQIDLSGFPTGERFAGPLRATVASPFAYFGRHPA
jgi:hypothetical protein